MGKIRRCKLSWQPVESEEIIGYRLYWSKGDQVDYDSNFFELGKIHEVLLPDVLKLDTRYETRIQLGLTAVDVDGNESDMVVLPKPYQTRIPPAPTGLTILTVDGDPVPQDQDGGLEKASGDTGSTDSGEQQTPLRHWAGSQPKPRAAENRIKYYDDVGYRRLEID